METKVRVIGGGFTTFNYRGRPIAWLDRVEDTGQMPQGTPYQAITPVGADRPREIVTQDVLAEGRLTVSIHELWNAPIWWQLKGLSGTDTVQDVFRALRRDPGRVTCTKIIKPPKGTQLKRRGYTYHNCTVYQVDDGDTITATGLSVARNLSIVYTHKTPL